MRPAGGTGRCAVKKAMSSGQDLVLGYNRPSAGGAGTVVNLANG